MPEFGAAPWLLTLLVLPLVWWLHRFRNVDNVVLVSFLELWRAPGGIRGDESARGRAHRVWLLRAAIVIALGLALAQPVWRVHVRAPVTVWIDDSLSMHTREGGRTRLASGVEQVVAQATRAGAGALTLRSLGDPALAFEFDSPAAAALDARVAHWARDPDGAVSPPSIDAMDPAQSHWLLSDGASEAVSAWARRAPLSRIIQVGELRDNAAVIAAALRIGPESPVSRQLLVTVRKSGNGAERRTLEVEREGAPLLRETLDMVGAQELRRVLPLDPVGEGTLRIRLVPNDALALDDEITIDPRELLPRRVALLGQCGAYLRAALNAIPMLAPADAATESADLVIGCGARPGAESRAAIELPAGAALHPVAGDPWWRAQDPRLRSLHLDRAWLRAMPLSPGSDETVLLWAGAVALITADQAAGRIRVGIDMESEPLVRQSAYPLLVAGLAQMALGIPLLDGIGARDRDPGASDIAPRRLSSASVSRNSEGGSRPDELSTELLVLAVLLLCVDLCFVSPAWAWFRTRRRQ